MRSADRRSQAVSVSYMASLGRIVAAAGRREIGPAAARERMACASDAPAQGGRVDGCVPPPGELVVQLEERDRESGHLQARDVAAHEAPPDADALALEDLGDAVERHVELDEGRAAHTVDEGEDGVAAA